MVSKCPFCQYPCHAICGKTYIGNTFIDMIVSLVISMSADSFLKSSPRLRAPFPFPPNLKLSHHTWFGRIFRFVQNSDLISISNYKTPTTNICFKRIMSEENTHCGLHLMNWKQNKTREEN